MKCDRIPEELKTGFAAINDLLPHSRELNVRFEKAECLKLYVDGDTVVIGYSSRAEALRGMSMAKRVAETAQPVCQKKRFDTLTIMVDCSRNSVPTPETVKELMVTAAMMGFNALMLYTEDTYEIPGQPYFGHMRGRYSMEELKALNAYGNAVGIELIPCIQTLAHLNCMLQWPVYAAYKDVGDILLAEDEKTLALIEQMLRVCKECFSTNRIHIGMDEAHLLGRGAYTDRNGYRTKAEIMLRHLEAVKRLCDKYGLEPIMWSDMFFRMQFNGAARVSEGELSQQVLDKIPEGVAMCYWDYYTTPAKSELLEHMFSQHARMQRAIWFAGGCWSWSGVAPKNYFSNYVTPNQLAYASKYGVRNVIATLWGDDGGECALWSMLPSLLQYGELNYAEATPENLEARCMDCFGMHYSDMLLLDQVGKPDVVEQTRQRPVVLEKMALYNDPLLGLMNYAAEGAQLSEKYARDAKLLAAVPDSRFDYLFKTQYMLAKLLQVKVELSIRIRDAYRSGDRQALESIVQRDIPITIERLDMFQSALYDQWHRINKPFGFEVQDLRQGGLRQRLFTASQRIREYLNGSVSRLEELEQPDLPRDPNRHVNDLNSWRAITTPGVVIF